MTAGDFSVPKTAMIMAAGEGRRMRPFTEKTPKPLALLAGRPLIDYSLDRLRQAGVEKVVVNLHHLGHQLRDHLASNKDFQVSFSDESDALLDTGGGIVKALDLLGEEPFFVLNADAPFFDADECSLLRLAQQFRQTRALAVLLLHPVISAVGYSGQGDYMMSSEGLLRRRAENMVSPFVFTGARILDPVIFRDAPTGPFSILEIFDRLQEEKRLYGWRHNGLWLQVNSVENLEEGELALRQL